MHGGAAPAARARREARILEGQARLRGEPVLLRDPGDALLAAAQDADHMLQRLKQDLVAGTVAPAQLTALGEWIDRVGRISKTVLDARIDEARVRLDERRGAILAGGLDWLLTVFGVDQDQQARRAVAWMLRQLEAGRTPSPSGVGGPVKRGDVQVLQLASGPWLEPVARREGEEVEVFLKGILRRIGREWSEPAVQAAVAAALDDLDEAREARGA